MKTHEIMETSFVTVPMNSLSRVRETSYVAKGKLSPPLGSIWAKTVTVGSMLMYTYLELNSHKWPPNGSKVDSQTLPAQGSQTDMLFHSFFAAFF